MSHATTPALKKYDVIFFICRAQPFTNGHKHNIDQALEQANRVVVVLGSAHRARDVRNPFTYEERKAMIRDVYRAEGIDHRISFRPQRDYPYSDTMWASYIQKTVSDYCSTYHMGRTDVKVGLIGHMKEDTYYLNLFPQWDFVPVQGMGDTSDMNATNVRKAYFEESTFHGREGAEYSLLDYIEQVTNRVPALVSYFLYEFKYGVKPGNISYAELTKPRTDGPTPVWPAPETLTDQYRNLKNEHFHIKKYRAAWDAAPYAPMFVTCDCLIVQSGHVLLIQRKAAPGKGLWAIPGGFLNQGERIVDGIFRELKEETVIKVPMKVLRGSLVGQHVYDHPQRSQRGRVITHAGVVHLEDGPLPKVKGSDDAAKAKWFPINEVYKMQDQFFEDHFFIIEDLLNRFPKK
jgi:bifunctional NMN adenylyltransferase/nudix hydrolase